jgi:hypothetical protein
MARKPLNLKIEKGALHKQMGLPQGKKIPVGLLASKAAALHRKSEKGKLSPEELKTSRRLAFAKAARGWKH